MRNCVAVLCASALAMHLLASPASAQGNSTADDSSSLSLSSDALSIIGYLLIGTFALTSLSFGVLGFLVGTQWPNPHVCCYNTPYSDGPRKAHACCSVYRLNFVCGVMWIVFFVVSAVSRSVARLLICLGFALMHMVVVGFLRSKFNTFGFVDRLGPGEVEIPTANPLGMFPGQMPALMSVVSRAATARGRPSPGIPVFNIPMTSAVVGGPLGSTDCCSCPACGGAVLPAYAFAPNDDGGYNALAVAMVAAMTRAGIGGELMLPGSEAFAPVIVPSGNVREPAVTMPFPASLLVVEGLPVGANTQSQRRRSSSSSLRASTEADGAAPASTSGPPLPPPRAASQHGRAAGREASTSRDASTSGGSSRRQQQQQEPQQDDGPAASGQLGSIRTFPPSPGGSLSGAERAVVVPE